MNINELTIGQAKELTRFFSGESKTENDCYFGIGKYVIVRCRDAGVHAGTLVSKNGRSCVLKDSRRLWYWKAKKGSFLSAVANYGLHSSSKVGCEVDIELTENCEIIICTPESEESIIAMEPHNE